MKTLINNTRKLTVLIFTVLPTLSAMAESNQLTLYGRIKESAFKNDLLNAKIYIIDDEGNRKDSLRVGSLSKYVVSDMHGTTDRSEFSLNVARKDSTYVFEVECDGYTPQTIVYKLENIGPRELSRSIPVIYLDRAPHKLGEVKVEMSKIKFYNRGDTLVYNADAFQLSAGSMLDGLIAQLPGVELDDNGRITVDGEFVETLLLNGKQFFDGNNNLMLQNIGAYTVKNIEVYRGHSMMEKFHGDINGPKHLIMDVKLKKQYSIGTILNAQAGYGTEDRYLGRLFASWFTSSTEVVAIGNINNLNDNREPGKNDSWTPDQMPTGTRRYQLGGLNYRYSSPNGGKFANGNVTYQGNRLFSRAIDERMTFFQTGNIYDDSHTFSKYKDIRVNTKHSFGKKFGQISTSVNIGGGYNKTDNSAQRLSGTFDNEQVQTTINVIESIYNGASAILPDDAINVSKVSNDGATKSANINGNAKLTYIIPSSPDRLYATLTAKYNSMENDTWRDFDIRYKDPSLSPTKQRNYTDGSPDKELTLSGNLGYSWRKGDLSGKVEYEYTFHNHNLDSYMYALQHMGEDMGIYGILPTGYTSVLDADNSYVSRQHDNTHRILLQFSYLGQVNGNSFQIMFNPNIGLQHSSLNYTSDGHYYNITRTSALLQVGEIDGSVRYQWGGFGKKNAMQILTLKFGVDTRTPDMLHLVDVMNTSDPLNISLGNTRLKNAYTYRLGLYYMIMPKSNLRNILTIDYRPTENALVRGFYYDKSSGVRYNKTYNVDGNNIIEAEDILNLQFGGRKQLNLSSSTKASNINSADMLGTDGVEPSPSKVRTLNLGETFRLSWQIGKQTISLNAGATKRHTTSSSSNFGNINASHYKYGLTGTFSLPVGFGISTDFTLYTRQGYGMKELDTTDTVWNLRATYTPTLGNFVFAIDGFDLLHKLSNIHYTINASGRSVTYTNTLPRYILFSVQYRFSHQPAQKDVGKW